MPRLRQAVLAARDLETTVGVLRQELGLGEPYRDPLVGYFGLANAVFALADGFLEVVSPVDVGKPGARTAERRLAAAGSGGRCGYMAMLQVENLAECRERSRAAGVREVFDVELPDMHEVHLHPADVHGPILALSEPRPASAWRWGGEGWAERAAPVALRGIEVAVSGDALPEVERLWGDIVGGPVAGVRFVAATGGAAARAGIVAIELTVEGATQRIDV